MVKNIEEFLIKGESFLPGNGPQLKLALLGILLKRNILIEDVPGMGKTTLVKFVARATGMDFRRIQFTSDLLPSDILGVSVFSKDNEQFIFRPGPIFGELILADELNRGTPKTQSALLQVMEEKQVSVDGINHKLPDRFSLFATQNPRGQYGTYPLPESQLDRFLFKFSMGQLNEAQELLLLQSGSRIESLRGIEAFITKEDLDQWEKEVRSVSASDLLLQYLARVLQKSRSIPGVFGLSPRAGLDILEAARGWAYLEERNYILPDDIQHVFPYVAGHRMYSDLSLSHAAEFQKARDFIAEIEFVQAK